MKNLKSLFLLSFLALSFNGAVATTVAQPTPIKIFFSDEIDNSSVTRLLTKIDQAIKSRTGLKEIVITLASMGGNLQESMRAARTIRALNNDPSIKIHTRVTDHDPCESACTVLYTAGNKRYADSQAQFGFHSPQFVSGGAGGLSRAELEEEFRKQWMVYISSADPKAAATIKERGYLYQEEMGYMSGEELSTGFVTDLL